MSFLKSIFRGKDKAIGSYAEFWRWFQKNERAFFKVVKEKGNIEKEFFDNLSPKLNSLRKGAYFLTGMADDHTVELVLTADGFIENIVFVEELADAAPKIEGWLFTKLKPGLEIKDVNISMAGYEFNAENLSFYSTDHSDYPDEIDITIVHNDLNADNKPDITAGALIFLDNFLGELTVATAIDSITVLGKEESTKELVPIAKLKDFLTWREKEFVEKYEGIRRDTENDNYSSLEATLTNGNILLAVVNTDLLEWDRKPSHPWIMTINIEYPGEDNNGMPDAVTYDLLNEIEDEITHELRDFDGYLNIGRQTAENERKIYFACKDFRRPSKVLFKIVEKYSTQLKLSYAIYKDKYWKSFNRFRG